MKADDENKENQAPKKVILFILSWMTVGAFGLGVVILTLGAVTLIRQADSASADAIVLLLIVALIFSTAWISLWPLKKKLFIKYARWALASGTVLTWAMIFLGLSVYTTSTLSSSSQCSDLKSQFFKAQSATVPIGTDSGTGTAFAVNDAHTLLTAYHVIEGATEVYGNYATGKVPVSVIATAPDFDLALLRIDQPASDFLTLTSNYNVTDQVYVYGYPGNTFSAGQASVSSGVLSRILPSEDLKLNNDQAPDGIEMIQTDAAINPGNSGGPLINRCGAVGIVNSISDYSQLHEYYGVVSEQGIGFAVSSKTASSSFDLPLSN